MGMQIWLQKQPLVEFLKNTKVDVNIEDKGGKTALLWASCNCHINIVVKLLNVDKVDLNLKDSVGSTALVWQAHTALIDCCRIVETLQG
jgi:ankyrin repeat protein